MQTQPEVINPPDSEDNARPQLEASLPEWCVLNWRQLVICSCFTLLFVTLNYLPLSVSTSWHDAWTGRWIVDNGVYNVDPSIPLAEGTQHAVDGWLGRVIVHQAHTRGGLEFLSFLFAATQTLVAALWAFLFVKLSQKWWAGIFPIVVMAGCYWHLDGISTRSFGQLCLALLAWLSVSTTWQNSRSAQRSGGWSIGSFLRVVGVFLVMVAWVNLDGSWAIGLALLAVMFASQVVHWFLKTEPTHIGSSNMLRQSLVLLECGLLASLLNPFGLQVWNAFFCWPDPAFWHALGGWQPMQVIGWQGLVLGLCLAFWLFATRQTSGLSPWHWMVAVFAIAVSGCSAATVTWTAPLVLLAAFAMLGSEVKEVRNENKITDGDGDTNSDAKPLRFAYTLMCGLVIWVGFSLSPASHFVLGGKGRTDKQILGDANPVLAMQILQNDSSPGLLWCPSYWSDRLLAIGEVKQVFANLEAHRLPAQVRHDYETLYNGQSGWKKILDRYAVNKLVIDKVHQPRMLHNLRATSQGWVKVHEDGQAVIFLRQNTVVDGSSPS